jgi:hypothetical protein
VFRAPAAVAATLISPSGKKVATEAAGSPAAAQPARALVARKPAAGKWKVVLTNTAPSAESVFLGADLTGGTVRLRPTAARNAKSRRLVITAQLLRSGHRLHGATVTAKVRGTSKPLGTLRLHDDGKHHDGAAHDGKYGIATRALPAGRYLVVVRAARKATVRLTSLLSS